jgi:asparagine synthase (glutamine-hydrolysing)
MLSTTPESRNETQPLTSDSEALVLVMDGRVDNREDLRRELLVTGAILRDDTDAELVLAAYAAWGEHCPDRIIGEFVFFVWDARQRRLFGARDAAGTRHFYYHEGNGWFAFASEIGGLLALGRIEPRLNESRLLDYLVIQFDRDDEVGTFYHGIDRMPAGHAMHAASGGTRSWRYWNPGNLSAGTFRSLDECAEAFLDQLRVAVTCRLRSTGPVGAMLSGGLDSSSIVALIRKEFRHELSEPLRTYSLIRDDRENCTDWPGVQEMLSGGWVVPRVIASDSVGDACRARLDSIGRLNEPFALSQGLPDSIVYEAASADGCRVVLDGMASDLCFYNPERSLEIIARRGYLTRTPMMLAACRHHGIDNALRTVAGMSLRNVTPERLRSIYRNHRDRRALDSNHSTGIPGDLRSLLDRDTARQYLADRMARRRQVARSRGFDNDQRLHALTFTSGMLSFAHEVNGQTALSKGVEPRSPFSDRRLIEFSIQMPLQAKLAAPSYKHLLRRSMRGILPDAVRLRRTLGGHPGWKFYERLISEMAKGGPEWSLQGVNDTLRRWIDPSSLGRAWSDYDHCPGYATGINLFTAAVLARWLADRHPTH